MLRKYLLLKNTLSEKYTIINSAGVACEKADLKFPFMSPEDQAFFLRVNGKLWREFSAHIPVSSDIQNKNTKENRNKLENFLNRNEIQSAISLIESDFNELHIEYLGRTALNYDSYGLCQFLLKTKPFSSLLSQGVLREMAKRFHYSILMDVFLSEEMVGKIGYDFFVKLAIEGNNLDLACCIATKSKFLGRLSPAAVLDLASAFPGNLKILLNTLVELETSIWMSNRDPIWLDETRNLLAQHNLIIRNIPSPIIVDYKRKTEKTIPSKIEFEEISFYEPKSDCTIS